MKSCLKLNEVTKIQSPVLKQKSLTTCNIVQNIFRHGTAKLTLNIVVPCNSKQKSAAQSWNDGHAKNVEMSTHSEKWRAKKLKWRRVAPC